MQPTDEVAQLGQRLLGLAVSLSDGLAHRFPRVGGRGMGQAEAHRERDESLPRAIVQVAFDAAPFDVGGVDHGRTARRVSTRRLSSATCSGSLG